MWILAQAARVLGEGEDAQQYAALAGEIKEAFNREFLDEETNQYGDGSQTANAVALQLDLVPADRVGAVVANLVEDIRVRQNGHLTTGIIGHSRAGECAAALRAGGGHVRAHVADDLSELGRADRQGRDDGLGVVGRRPGGRVEPEHEDVL